MQSSYELTMVKSVVINVKWNTHHLATLQSLSQAYRWEKLQLHSIANFGLPDDERWISFKYHVNSCFGHWNNGVMKKECRQTDSLIGDYD